PLELEFVYDRLAEHGLNYGPAFQGLSAAWRDGTEVYAEVSLADEQVQSAGLFGLHPALLDSAFHAALDLTLGVNGEAEPGKLSLPFAWRGASIATAGASSLRVRVALEQGGFGFTAIDQSGVPVIAVDSLALRPVEQSQLQTTHQRKSLYRVEWTEVEARRPTNGSQPPRVLILGEKGIPGIEAERCPDLRALLRALEEGKTPAVALLNLDPDPFLRDAGGDVAAAFNAAGRHALELAQAWVAAEPSQNARLAFLTKRAVALGDGEDPSLVLAPVWGLLRSAQSEYPGRFALIDVDETAASLEALPAALGSGDEPQLALREGTLRAPRLMVAQATKEETSASPIDPGSTVLVTGGTGGLGAVIARHLVTQHGVRHLLLVSRRGPGAEGARELESRLTEDGAEVTIAACDVSVRGQLEALIDAIPHERPLGAVFHAAGVLDDGVLESLDGGRLERVMGPKADAAWHLHELTKGLDLSRFVMFSSAAGLLGGPAQANYAAANALLDALAWHRRAQGLPAASLAWGLWEQESGMAKGLSDAELAQFKSQARARLGFVPIVSARGVELFDAALVCDEPLLAPVEFDRAALRARAEAGALQPILRGLVRAPVRPALAGESLASKLAGLSEPERQAAVLELVRTHVAAVLGHGSADLVEADRAFQELGFDSLAAIELRNRLNNASGLHLPATLVFDYPTSATLAAYLQGEATESGGAEKVAVRAQATDEPIAIVGMSCRYPGGVSSTEELWGLVAGGSDGVSEFPGDRGWDLARLYDADPDHPGTSYAREGGFVGDAADFDPGFFGISPREALALDPQTRLLLEGCWEALEDAGIDPWRLRGSQAGVFAGVMYHDYGVASGITAELEGYMTTVGTGSIVSGRVAYTLGLEGPTMSVDTACSSSLVAMHLAAQALRQGECSLALA
ncbi:MAG TPA: SDR family NAD(P)-dependent oxidoreductase, partial [Solirubrobacterales bacterium]